MAMTMILGFSAPANAVVYNNDFSFTGSLAGYAGSGFTQGVFYYYPNPTVYGVSGQPVGSVRDRCPTDGKGVATRVFVTNVFYTVTALRTVGKDIDGCGPNAVFLDGGTWSLGDNIYGAEMQLWATEGGEPFDYMSRSRSFYR